MDLTQSLNATANTAPRGIDRVAEVLATEGRLHCVAAVGGEGSRRLRTALEARGVIVLPTEGEEAVGQCLGAAAAGQRVLLLASGFEAVALAVPTLKAMAAKRIGALVVVVSHGDEAGAVLPEEGDEDARVLGFARVPAVTARSVAHAESALRSALGAMGDGPRAVVVPLHRVAMASITAEGAAVTDEVDHDAMPFRAGLLAGRVALITGGGTGIGRATAEVFADLGATVALCGRRIEPVTEVAEALRARGAVAHAASVDIRKPEAVDAFVDELLGRHGRIDVLVNNAGGQFPAPAENLPPKGFEAVVRNNLLGTYTVTHAVGTRAMILQRRGRIINVIANIARGFPGMSHTGAARAGVENLTKSLAVEWSRYRINVNAVSPGTIRSSGTDRYPPELLQKAERVTPWGRLGTPAEVANLITYLSIDASDYVTGATYCLDGGSPLWGDIWEIVRD